MMNTSPRTWLPRVVISLAILVSGVALTPYVDLPREQLDWRLYAGIYEPLFVVNHPSGQPGSYFTLRGSNFPANSRVLVTLQHSQYGTQPLATLQTDNAGQFMLLVWTGGSPAGVYTLRATANVNATAGTNFLLDPGAPLWPQEDQGLIVRTPGSLYVPILFRNS